MWEQIGNDWAIYVLGQVTVLYWMAEWWSHASDINAIDEMPSPRLTDIDAAKRWVQNAIYNQLHQEMKRFENCVCHN